MISGRRLAFWAITALGFVLAMAQLVLVLQTWSDPIANAHYWRLATLFQGVAGGVYLLMGLVVIRRKPEISIGWLLAGIGLGILAYQLASEYAIRALLVEAPPWRGGAEAAMLSMAMILIPVSVILWTHRDHGARLLREDDFGILPGWPVPLHCRC